MKKYFNIAGPCLPDRHYMLSALERNPEVWPLVEKGEYFVVHAARQTGKTTLLKSLVDKINSEEDYYALYVSLEGIQYINDPEKGIPQILEQIKTALYFEEIDAKKELDGFGDKVGFTTLLHLGIAKFCKALQKPLVLLFDEVDCLSNGTLVTFLRQLRAGYNSRANIPFAHSVALVGMRNIRDYKSKIREEKETLGSASPFNIVTESLSLGNFSFNEVFSLFNQHHKNTGQGFNKKVLERIFYWTNGQPWLVNAIAREIVVKILVDDYSKTITEEMVDQAAKNIILRRDTHIDSLLERLKEERVKNIVQPMLLGKLNYSLLEDDTQYCIDLGIVKNHKGELIPSNPLYGEVIVRTLTTDSQHQLTNVVKPIWLNDDNSIDMNGLLKGFQQFWRENSEIWVEKYQYREAAPHLILQAFMQRVINGGGTVDREYATGRRRIDLCVNFHSHKYPVELKLYYNEKTYAEGLKQISDYMDKLGEKVGWLVIFDRETDKDWEEKIYSKTETLNGKTIFVFGC